MRVIFSIKDLSCYFCYMLFLIIVTLIYIVSNFLFSFFFATSPVIRLQLLFLILCRRLVSPDDFDCFLYFKASFLSHHPYTSAMIAIHPFCEKVLAQFHPCSLRANFKFLLSTVHHDRLRTPGVRRIHSQWRACEQGLCGKSRKLRVIVRFD